MKSHKLGIGLATVLLVVATTGCGKAADKVAQKVTEKGIEKSIESQSGGKVDIDSDGGSFKVKNKDGSEYSMGTGSKLPDDWPKVLAIPKGFEVKMSTTMKIDGNPRSSVTATGHGDDAPKLFATLRKRVVSAGYEIDSESNNNSKSSSTNRISATKGDSKVSVQVMAGGDENEITISLVHSIGAEDD